MDKFLEFTNEKIRQKYNSNIISVKKKLLLTPSIAMLMVNITQLLIYIKTKNLNRVILSIAYIIFYSIMIIIIKKIKINGTLVIFIEIILNWVTSVFFCILFLLIKKEILHDNQNYYETFIFVGYVMSSINEIIANESKIISNFFQSIGNIVIIFTIIPRNYATLIAPAIYSVFQITKIILYYYKEKTKKTIFMNDYISRKNSKIWKHMMLEVNPGIIAILNIKKSEFKENLKNISIFKMISKFIEKLKNKKKKNKKIKLKNDDKNKKIENNENIEICEKNEKNPECELNLECVNNIAKNEYVIKNLEDFKNLLNNLEITGKINKNFKGNSPLEKKIADKEENFFYLEKKIVSLLSKNLKKKTNFKMYKGWLNAGENNEKMKVELCPFIWNDEKSLLFKAENIDMEDELKNLQKLDKYKDQMLASVTHDLRSPLYGIKYMLAKAKEYGINGDIENLEKYLKMADINAELLMSLISDILDLSLIKENKLRINHEEFYLQEFVNQVFELMKIQAELKKIELKVELQTNSDRTKINTDSKRLKQVLINLIGNSIKFTVEGEIILRIKETDQLFEISVSDTGVGMPSEVKNNLFKPFATFDSKKKLNKQGIGLGLNICKTIVGFLGPENVINVESEENKGSTFSFQIFKKNLNEKNEQSNKEIELNYENNNSNSLSNLSFNLSEEEIENDIFLEFQQFKKKKNVFSIISNKYNFSNNKPKNVIKEEIINKPEMIILIADDNVFFIMILTELLKSIKDYNIEIITASDGQYVIDIFNERNKLGLKKSIDLIITDVEMPRKNGIQAAKVIKNLLKKKLYEKCFIALHTSYSLKENLKAKKYSDFILNKPTTKDELIETLENVDRLI